MDFNYRGCDFSACNGACHRARRLHRAPRVYTAVFCALCGDEPYVYFHKFHRRFGVYLHRREQKSCVCKHFAAVYSALRNGVYAHFFALSLHFDYAELFFDGASFQKTSPESDFRGDTAFADFICFSHSLYTA